MGVRTRVRTHFFATWRGPARERTVRSTHRRGAAPEEKFSHQKRTFTPHFVYKKWVIRSCASGFTEYFFAYVTFPHLPQRASHTFPHFPKSDLFKGIPASSCIPPPVKPSPPQDSLARRHDDLYADRMHADCMLIVFMEYVNVAPVGIRRQYIRRYV